MSNPSAQKKQKLSSLPISVKAVDNYLSESKAVPDDLTLNGAYAFSTTGSAITDLFFAMARGCKEERVTKLMENAWKESSIETCLVLLNCRDCRNGKAERLVTYHALIWIRLNHPEIYKHLLPLVVQVGSFADLRKLAHLVHGKHKKEEENKSVVVEREYELELLAAVLKQDRHQLLIANNIPNPNISLAAKWAPSEKKADDRRYDLAKKLAYLLLAPTHDQPHSGVMHRYRNLISELRKKIQPVEQLLASKQFSKIDYNKQTSRGHHVYKKAFFRNDGERYKEYLSSLKKQQEENKSKPESEQKKELKININTLFPHEITKDLIQESSGWNRYCSVNQTELDLRQTQWTATIEKYKKSAGLFNNAVALVDVSGSMFSGSYGTSVQPIHVSVALGLLTATLCTKSRFAHRIITFESTPRWFTIDVTKPIQEQVSQLCAAPWSGSTNFEAAFELILNEATTQEDVPEVLVCFSDMQFNAAANFNGYSRPVSLFHHIKEKFEQRELKMPKLVFWNVNSDLCENTPVTHDESGTALISGFSPALMKALLDTGLNSDGFNPKVVVNNAIEPYQTLLTDELRNLLK